MKKQVYVIRFNTQMNNVEEAMDILGNAINSKIIELIAEGMMTGTISPQNPLLSDDGLVLSVIRTFTDSSYEELSAIQTPTEIKNILNSLDCVDSVTYDFTDL